MFWDQAKSKDYLSKFIKVWNPKQGMNLTIDTEGFKDIPIAMATTHMDDLGVAGPKGFVEALHVVVEDRFGACPLQKDSFKHIGHFYETFHHKRYLGLVTHLGPFVVN